VYILLYFNYKCRCTCPQITGDMYWKLNSKEDYIEYDYPRDFGIWRGVPWPLDSAFHREGTSLGSLCRYCTGCMVHKFIILTKCKPWNNRIRFLTKCNRLLYVKISVKTTLLVRTEVTFNFECSKILMVWLYNMLWLESIVQHILFNVAK